MKSLFVIESPNGMGYALFYFLAFLTGLVILLIEGRRRKFPSVRWLLVIATSFLFFIVGTQAIKFTPDDWTAVLSFKNIERDPGRSVLGGILLGTVGLLLAKYFFKFRHNVLDAFAWVAPVGLVIQRVGCLLAGCCYGTTTDLPWGVVYGSSSHAFDNQVQNQVIDVTRSLALPVHPVPLYEMLGCILIIFVLVMIRNKIFVSGNRFLALLVLYGVLRFATEFFRAESFGIETHEGINAVQTVILIVVPLLVGWIFWREKKSAFAKAMVDKSAFAKATVDKSAFATAFIKISAAKKTMVDKSAFARTMVDKSSSKWPIGIYFLLISALFLIVSRWLSMLEIMTLNLVLLPTLILISWHLFKSVTVPRMRVATCVMIVGSLLLMSQTLPDKSRSDTTKSSYSVLSFGLSGGSVDFNRVYYQNSTSGCNGPGTAAINDKLHNSSTTFGVGYARVVLKNSRSLQYGIDAYVGGNQETYSNSIGANLGETSNHVSIAGIHPYVQYDWRDVGLGAGLHMGSLTLPRLPDNPNGGVVTSITKVSAYPSFYLRLGQLDGFFWENKVSQQFPSPFPALSFQTNFGIALRSRMMNRSAIRFGTASSVGFFVAPIFSFRNVVLEPYLGGGPGLFTGTSSGGGYAKIDQGSTFQGAISVRVKLGR